MILDNEPVTRVAFHPRPEPAGYEPKGIPTLTSSDDAAIAGYLHESQASDTLMVFFHGNGEIAADYDGLAPMYIDCGLSCWIVDYRGYGRSTGIPSFSDMLKDAEAIFADIPRIGSAIGRDFKQIIIMGRSLGSASAIHLASIHSSSLAGLILDSPYADGLALISRLGGPNITRRQVPGLNDNVDKICQCNLPTLIIHGTEDRIIPISDAQTLFKGCPNTKKQFLKIQGAGHNNLLLVGFAEYCRKLKGFIIQATQ